MVHYFLQPYIQSLHINFLLFIVHVARAKTVLQEFNISGLAGFTGLRVSLHMQGQRTLQFPTIPQKNDLQSRHYHCILLLLSSLSAPIHPQYLVTFEYAKYLRAFALSTPAAKNVLSSDSPQLASSLFFGLHPKVINQ